MRASWLAGLVATAALAAACSTLTPAQDRSLDEIRAFADDTARRYGLLPIHVLVSHNPDSPVGSYRRGFFAVNQLVLGSEFRDAIVAHLREQLRRDNESLTKLVAQKAATPHEFEENRLALAQAEANRWSRSHTASSRN